MEREPQNRHDANAVRVLRQNGEQLGYLPAHVVGTGLARDLDKGCHFRVVVDAITGRDKETLGVNIKITEVGDPNAAIPPTQTASATVTAPLVWFALIVLVLVILFGFYKMMTAG